RQPAVSPDGTNLAYLRSSPAGTARLMRSFSADHSDEREVVSATRFPDIFYPRFSPRGDEIVLSRCRLLRRVVLYSGPSSGLGPSMRTVCRGTCGLSGRTERDCDCLRH